MATRVAPAVMTWVSVEPSVTSVGPDHVMVAALANGATSAAMSPMSKNRIDTRPFPNKLHIRKHRETPFYHNQRHRYRRMR